MLFLIIRWLVLEVWTTCRWLQNTCTKSKQKLNSWAVGQSNPFIMSEIKEQKNPTEMCWNKPGPLVSYGIPYKSKCRRIENNSLKQIPGFCCEQLYSKSLIKHYIVIIYSWFFWLDGIFLFTFPEALLRVRTSTLSKCHPAKRPALSWPILSFVSSPTSSSWKEKHTHMNL